MKNIFTFIFAISSLAFLSNCSHQKGHHDGHHEKKAHKEMHHSGGCEKCMKHSQAEADKYLKHVSEGTPIGKLAAPSYKHMSFAAQPSKEELTEAKKQGYKVIINLRDPSEVKWDEAAFVKTLGLKYYNVPLLDKAGEIDAAAIIKLERIHKETHNEKQLIHCSSGNRAAAWMSAHLMVKHELSVEDAIKVGKKLGITKDEIEKKVVNFSDQI